MLGKGKDKVNVDLYSAFSRTPVTRSDMDNILLPANNTISAFARKHSHSRHHAYTHSERLTSTYLLIYRPQESE